MKVSNIFNLTGKYNSLAAIILGGLVAVILIGLFLVRPAWSRLSTLGTEIPTEQVKRDQAKLDFENLEKAKKFFSENGRAIEEVNTAVPTQPDVPSILVILESIAKQNNVFLTAFTPQQLGQTAPSTASRDKSGNVSGVDSVEISANFRGQYSSLINFLYSLERSLRIVDVKTISVSSSASVLDGNISFRAYYKTVEGVTPAATTSPSPGGGK